MKALEEEWREETREILADAFSDAMGGFGGYRKYMSNQIGNYLKEHMNMPPLAVVLVGILSEPITYVDVAMDHIAPIFSCLPMLLINSLR